MSAYLKDCPFCGCHPTFVKHSAGMPNTRGFDKWDAVACKHCGATVGACDRRFRNRDDAADAWNRRIPLAKEPTPCEEVIAIWNKRAAVELNRAWLPIESAPKDGGYVLISNSHGAWVAKWHPIYQSGYRPSNPWASMMLNHDHIDKPGRFDIPTHWMPLPPPPEHGEGK